MQQAKEKILLTERKQASGKCCYENESSLRKGHQVDDGFPRWLELVASGFFLEKQLLYYFFMLISAVQ